MKVATKNKYVIAWSENTNNTRYHNGEDLGTSIESQATMFETEQEAQNIINECNWVNCYVTTYENPLQIQSIDMARGNGYGQYSIVVEFSHEGEKHRKSFHTTDSQLWDNDNKTGEDLLNHIGGEQRLLDVI